jgi:predicted lipoprotein with Yx(FWY)xxD motif
MVTGSNTRRKDLVGSSVLVEKESNVNRYKKGFLNVVGAFMFLLLLAGCASTAPVTSSPTGTAGSSMQSTQAPAAKSSVKVASLSVGNILVNNDEMTLYILTADPSGQSTCSGGCATAWPPVTITGEPVAGQGVDPSLLGTLTRPDGSQQLTYAGHALYTYSADRAPGDVNGQGIESYGGTWYVMGPDGQPIPNAVSSSAPGSSY